jgi:hypothetical protein
MVMHQKTVFLEVFGDSPIQKVLDFLIVNDDFDHSMTDIAELSAVGYSTLKLFWPKLEVSGIVKHTRTVGNAKMYELDTQNVVVKKLKELYWTVTKNSVHEEHKVKVIKH